MRGASITTEPHYLVCYFGAKYAPMLGVLLQSIAEIAPDRKVVLLHYDTPVDVLRMACNYPNVIARPVEKQAYHAAMAAALKPLIIADYLDSPTLAGPALVVDCDMLIRRDPFELFREGDGILFTTRDGVWPINGGIIGIRDPHQPAVSQFFRRWAERIAEIARDPALVAVARSEKHPYGHVDQMAFAQTIGYERHKTEFRLTECADLSARAIDGYILNETRSVPISPETRILHYKGGWHPILLDGHTFTRNRPMRAGWEMFTLYCDVLSRATTNASHVIPEAMLDRTPAWYIVRTKTLVRRRYCSALFRDTLRGLLAHLRVRAAQIRDKVYRLMEYCRVSTTASLTKLPLKVPRKPRSARRH
jgi:hypothetical protein